MSINDLRSFLDAARRAGEVHEIKKEVDPVRELGAVLRALGASRTDILLKIGLPRSLPYFFASLKVAITLAFVGSVVSETVASNDGIGYLMMSAGSQMRMPLVFAGLVVISAMAIVMYEVFAVLERRLTGWATRGMDARV